MNRKQIGTIGERYAAHYLKNKNYYILQTNFKCRYGEIDIIAKDKKSIVFVEVKTRTSTKYGRGMEAVNYYKQNKIKKAALVYLKSNPKRYLNVRFDVIDIFMKNDNNFVIQHIQNAF